jgi:hypothetical protein
MVTKKLGFFYNNVKKGLINKTKVCLVQNRPLLLKIQRSVLNKTGLYY